MDKRNLLKSARTKTVDSHNSIDSIGTIDCIDYIDSLESPIGTVVFPFVCGVNVGDLL